ncbi:MAG: AMP-binding protein [Candidatus Dormibacteraeota bacterium]|nr:AMP-binding protein [Candidatus Dormibacteraeota bacterium]
MRTVAEVIRWRAQRHPDLPATWFQGRIRTFGELDARSSALAGGLTSGAGLRPGDRVAVLDKNSDDYVELLVALAKAGVVAVPVNWRLTPPEVKAVVGDAKAKLLVVGPGLEPAAGAVEAPVVGYDDLARGGDDPRADREEAVAWQLYTSGTTGLPKGAMLTNLNLVAGLGGSLAFECPEIRQGGRGLVAMPLYHIGGSGWLLGVIAGGACAVLVREVVPAELLQVIVEQQVQTGFLVPAVLLFLTQLPRAGQADFSALESILYGASPISQDLLRRAIETFGCRFTQVYGLTETTGAITALQHEHHGGERLLSCGRAMFGGEITILDPEGRVLERGQIGEVAYRGPGVMAGYWNRPEDTRAVTTEDGWFRTGDAGTMDEEGFVYIRDRIKDMIVSGGENIYPAELESVLAGHSQVADVAVIGVPDERWGEVVKAVVVRRPGSELSADELVSWARERLAGFKLPRSVDFVEAVPRNPSGKILKRELREPYWAALGRRVN